MPRPRKFRRVGFRPDITLFKPAGVKARKLEVVSLTLDEMEAVRLADLQELYQANAAEKMNVSRQTFGNIINAAHKKIADALVNGKGLQISGGSVHYQEDESGDEIAKDQSSDHQD